MTLTIAHYPTSPHSLEAVWNAMAAFGRKIERVETRDGQALILTPYDEHHENRARETALTLGCHELTEQPTPNQPTPPCVCCEKP